MSYIMTNKDLDEAKNWLDNGAPPLVTIISLIHTADHVTGSLNKFSDDIDDIVRCYSYCHHGIGIDNCEKIRDIVASVIALIDASRDRLPAERIQIDDIGETDAAASEEGYDAVENTESQIPDPMDSIIDESKEKWSSQFNASPDTLYNLLDEAYRKMIDVENSRKIRGSSRTYLDEIISLITDNGGSEHIFIAYEHAWAVLQCIESNNISWDNIPDEVKTQIAEIRKIWVELMKKDRGICIDPDYDLQGVNEEFADYIQKKNMVASNMDLDIIGIASLLLQANNIYKHLSCILIEDILLAGYPDDVEKTMRDRILPIMSTIVGDIEIWKREMRKINRTFNKFDHLYEISSKEE